MGNAETNYELAGIRFDPALGTLNSAAGSCQLEPRASKVLALLFREQGRLITRQQLLDECWGEGAGSDEALTQAIAQVRRSLETLRAPREILTTHPKRGYRLANSSAPPFRLIKSIPLWAAWGAAGAILIGLLLILAFAPHWPRHVIRHALGLGPPHAQHLSPGNDGSR